MNRFIRELRRREVLRTAGLYVGVTWILIEAASVLLPTFDAPDWVMRAVVIVAIVGFPVMLVLAWVYNPIRSLHRSAAARWTSQSSAYWPPR
jgi:hypothetical protein